jgi:hypothetical protein
MDRTKLIDKAYHAGFESDEQGTRANDFEIWRAAGLEKPRRFSSPEWASASSAKRSHFGEIEQRAAAAPAAYERSSRTQEI